MLIAILHCYTIYNNLMYTKQMDTSPASQMQLWQLMYDPDTKVHPPAFHLVFSTCFHSSHWTLFYNCFYRISVIVYLFLPSLLFSLLLNLSLSFLSLFYSLCLCITLTHTMQLLLLLILVVEFVTFFSRVPYFLQLTVI